MLSEIKDELKTKSTSIELQDLVAKLEEKERRLASLELTVSALNEDLKVRDDKISELEKRVSRLDVLTNANSCKNAVLENCNKLLERKCDDHEQISRKVNLRLIGIDLKANETPDSLLDDIKAECNRLELGLSDADFDHCHRNGKIDSSSDKQKQAVLLKMRSWRGRNTIYENRKKFTGIKVYHDLTYRRKTLLFETGEMINIHGVSKVADYVMADKNCKLKLKASNGRYFQFNSIEEFTGIVHKLQNDLLGPEFNSAERSELFN